MALTVRKPAPAKPALAKPAAKPANGVKAAAKAAKPAKPAKPVVAKPAKETKPFENGEIVIFKKYTAKAEGQNFTEGEELAIVGQSTKEGHLFLAVVKSSQYHKFVADADSVNGEEVLPDEIKRTNKHVPPPFNLPVVGDMATILKTADGDPLEIAKKLWSDAQKSFFYFGGILAKLWNETDADTDKRIFTGYTDSAGKNFEDSKEGFEKFVIHNFGTDMSYRKAAYYMSIYQQFSALDNAADVIKQLGAVGWWKAGMLAQYVTNDNAKELVEVAQKQSSEKLAETLKTSYTTEGSTPRGNQASRAVIKRTSFEFKLYEDQGVAVETIMRAAAKQTGIADLNQLFEHIIHEWASEHMAETANKAKAAGDRQLKALKKSGVKLPSDHPAAEAVPAAAG